MTSYRSVDGFDCIAFPRIALRAGVYPKNLKSTFELVAAIPESDNKAAARRLISVDSTNQRSGTYFALYSVTHAGVYSLSGPASLGRPI